jgi:hypothetical protein
MRGDRRARAQEAAALAGLGLFVVTLSLSPIIDYDLFLHLKTGAVILETGHVPQVDDYSALARGRPFVAHEWLAEVLFRLIERGFGRHAFPALTCLAAFVALATAASLYGTARLLGASAFLAVPMLGFVMVLAAARLVVRPHLFSYLMTAVFLLLLSARRAGRRIPPWTFLSLQVAWANLHGGFLLGPMLVGLAAIGARVEGGLASPAAGAVARPPAQPRSEALRLGLLAAALPVACLLNPYGARLLLFPFRLSGTSFMGEIYEWRPPFASAFAGTYMARYYVAWIVVGAATILGVLVAFRRRRAAPPAWAFGLLLFGALLALSLRMNRAVTDFGLATFPGLAAALTWLAGDRLARLDRPPIRLLVTLSTIAGLSGLAGWFALNGYPYRPGSVRPFGFGVIGNTPVLAADYLEANGVRGNVFNSYGAGPYLIYRLYPSIRVAMDSRNDVYGEAIYDEYKKALVDPVALGALLQHLDAVAVVLDWVGGKNLPTARLLRRVGPWVPVSFDDAALVYMRADGEARGLVDRDGYALLDPAGYRPGAFRPEDAERALREAERAVAASRGSTIARVMKIDALLALGRRDDARGEEARLLAMPPDLPYIYVFLGDLWLGSGDRETAGARYRKALDLAPGWGRALDGLRASGAAP